MYLVKYPKKLISNLLKIQLFFFYSACKVNEVQLPAIPTESGSEILEYKLDEPLKPGLSGNVKFIKLSDGSTRAEISINGRNRSSRYFGKLSKSNALDLVTKSDISDLNEFNSNTGQSVTWVNKDYLNRQILFDSISKMDAMVRILEMEADGSLSEVLRGDIGANLLTSKGKSFALTPANGSGVNGTLEFKERLNGNYVLTTTFEGLSANENYPINIYRGDLEEKQFVFLSQIVDFSGNQKTFRSSFPKDRIDLKMLDTLKGFIGLAASKVRQDSVLAFVNLENNKATGRKDSIPIFNSKGNTKIGILKFEEKSGGKLKVNLKINALPADSIFYLTFIQGNTNFQPIKKPFQSFLIPASGLLSYQNQKRDSSNRLSFDDLKNWDAHLRITIDTLNFTSTYGLAELGGNQFSGAQKTITMTPADDAGWEGTVELKARKNGNVLTTISLNKREGFVNHLFSLRKGKKETAAISDSMLVEIAIIDGGNGDSFSLSYDLGKTVSGIPIKWSYFENLEAYFEFAIYDEPVDEGRFPKSRGDN